MFFMCGIVGVTLCEKFIIILYSEYKMCSELKFCFLSFTYDGKKDLMSLFHLHSCTVLVHSKWASSP